MYADREPARQLYRKEHNGSEAGLGDLVLQAWDQSAANASTRAVIQKRRDPNSGASNPMEFTLSSVEGPALALASLKGKVLVSISGRPGAALAASSTLFTRRFARSSRIVTMSCS